MKSLKRLVMILSLFIAFTVGAQTRVEVSPGLYLVSYGNTAVIEDDVNQQTISIEVAQDGIDRATGEKVYNVVCGRWTKRVVKDGLKAAIDAGVVAAGATKGASLIVSEAARLAGYFYDDLCDYFGSDF